MINNDNVVPNLNGFISSVEHKSRYIKKKLWGPDNIGTETFSSSASSFIYTEKIKSGLERQEDEQMMTELVFLGEL